MNLPYNVVSKILMIKNYNLLFTLASKFLAKSLSQFCKLGVWEFHFLLLLVKGEYIFCINSTASSKMSSGYKKRLIWSICWKIQHAQVFMMFFTENKLGIRKIHGHTDTRTLYTDLLFWINFWKLEKYTDPLEKYTDPLIHGFNTQNLEN